MNVVTCLDAGYALPFFALLRSVNRQPPSTKLRLYVVGGGLDARLVHRIRRCASSGISRLHFLEADARSVAHFPLQRWITRAAYLKLLAPGLLPEDAERAILLDSDLIVQSDLTPLWNADMTDRLLLAVQDFGCPYVSSSFGIKRYRELGLPADAPYFNSGVMLVDLERWRDEDVARRCFRYLESHAADLRCHDQEALNAVAANRWGQLDPRWNQMPHVHRAESLPASPYRERLLAHRQALVSAPHIVHFAGREKPWLPGCRHPARGLFIRELRSSGYFSLVRFLRWRWNLSRASWRRQMEVISPWDSSADEEAFRNRRRYRWMDITRISAGRHHVWLHSARSGVARVVPSATAHTLFACDSFRTLDTHARRLAGAALLASLRMPAERRGGSRLARVARRQLARSSVVGVTPLPLNREAVLQYRRQLEDFVRDGFLVADTALFAASPSPNDSAEFGELSCVTVSALGIPTRDRPELFRRCLLSYADNLRRHDREAALLVVDDSRLLASVDLNAASAKEVAKLSGLDITVVDRRWRAEYAQRLAAASGAPQEVVKFALLGDDRCPLSHGAARNTLQLLSIGSAVIHVDDDTICRLGRVVERPDASKDSAYDVENLRGAFFPNSSGLRR